MPRPDLTQERTAQILDAFEFCVARFGLEGTTLERVANQAGVQRSLIRHYLGNREHLLLAWVERSVHRYREQLDELISALPNRQRAKKLVDYLFLQDSTGPTEGELVMDLVIAAADRLEESRKLVARFLQDLIDTVAGELSECFPKAPGNQVFDTASAVVAMSLCAESLAPLRLPRRYPKAWKQAAHRLVAELRDS